MTEPVKQKGKAWAVVRVLVGGGVVHKVETTPTRIDRVISGMLVNMDRERFYVDEWYQFPFGTQKDKDGKQRKGFK